MPTNNIGSIRGTIEIDYDGSGIVKAIRDTDNATKETGKLDKAMTKILSVFGSFAKGAAKVGAACLAISGGLNLVAGVLATLGPLVGAGLAALPAIIFSAVGAIGVLRVALSGVKDAFGAANKPADVFNAAIKKLPPNLAATVKAYRASLPALKSFRDALQNSLFKGLDVQLRKTAGSIGAIQPAAKGVVGAVRSVIVAFAEWLRTPKAINAITVGLNNAKTVLQVVAKAVKPLLNGFAGLAAQGDFFSKLIKGPLANALASLSNWLSSINLAEVFASARPIITALGTAFSTLGGILGPIFSTLTNGGSNAAGILGALAQQLAAFLASAQGKQALDAIGQAFEAISTGAGQIFLALLQALAPALVALAPGITSLANLLTSLLVPAINALAPALQNTAGWISDNIDWLGPLALAVVGVAGAYKIFKAGQEALDAVLTVSKTIKNSDALAWIALRAQVVATKIQTAIYAAYLRGQAIAAWAANTAAMVANKVAMIASALVAKAQLLPALIASVAQMVAQKVALIASTVAMYAVRAAVIAWTAVQWLLNAALDANPIGAVIIVIGLLITGIVLLWKHSETFRNIVLAVWSAIKTAMLAVFNWIKDNVVPGLKRAWDLIVAGVKLLWAAWKAEFNAIKNVVMTVIGWIVAFIRAEINTIVAVWRGVTKVIGIVTGAFKSAYNAVKTWIGNAVNVVKGAPGKFVAALGKINTLLYNKGKDLVQGFINGIKSMFGKASSVAKDLVHAVTKWLPGSPAEVGPLSGKGYVLLRGQRFTGDFAHGIEKASELPSQAMARVVAPIAAIATPTVSTGLSGRPGDGASAGGGRDHGPYQLIVDGKVLAEFVIDTVTGQPKMVDNTGNEGARQNSWAGSGRGK